MKFILKSILIGMVFISFSCQKEEESAEAKAFDAQMKQTIQIHDDVMPQMSKISSLITELESEKEELESLEEVNALLVDKHDVAIADLQKAHDIMMAWMKNFSSSFSRTEINTGLQAKDKDSIKAKVELLKMQYNSAEEMKAAISSSLENAKKVLDEQSL
jgi:methyl coenzyme M reductase subunit D